MNTFANQYRLALKMCKFSFPFGVFSLEALGLILWIKLAETGYGLPIGLPIMLFGGVMAIVFFFAIKYMERKLAELEKSEQP